MVRAARNSKRVFAVQHYERLAYTPACPLVIKANASLAAEGYTGQVVVVNWDDAAVAAVSGGKAVGVISYTHQDWTKTLYVKLGYVEPTWRRRGVYTALWARLVKRAQELNCAQIRGSTSLRNFELRATAKKLGRIEVSVELAFDVPGYSPEAKKVTP